MDMSTGLFIVIVGAAVAIVAASSSRDSRTPRFLWILLGLVVLIAVVLTVILANRHGV